MPYHHLLATHAVFLASSFACVHAADIVSPDPTMDRVAVSSSTHQVHFDTAAKELEERTFAYTFGHDIKTTVTQYADQIFGVWMISVVTEFENTGSTPLHYAGYVAFLDAKGALLASANVKADALENGESWELKPGQRKKTGKTIALPFSSVAKITTVHAILYESADVIGVQSSEP